MEASPGCNIVIVNAPLHRAMPLYHGDFDACYDRDRIVGLKRILNDRAPEPILVGISYSNVLRLFVSCLSHGVAHRVTQYFPPQNVFGCSIDLFQ